MLLDKYVLTTSLTSLLTHSPLPFTPSSTTSFTKRVHTTLTRLDPLLKTLQVRPSPPEGLVQAYLIHIGDRSDTNFRKILELKGVRKADQPSLVELFGIHRDGKSNSHLVQSSPLLTPLMNTTSLGSSGLGISGLGAAAPKGFDAAGFGEKLFSAARDGVDRMGTGSPSLGGDGEVKLGVEGNLKSIGKFFRRDMSGFGGIGGRFGGKSGDDGR
jgi:hypothetical protein